MLVAQFTALWDRTVEVGLQTDPALRTSTVMKLAENARLFRGHDPCYSTLINAEFLALVTFFHDEATREVTVQDRATDY